MSALAPVPTCVALANLISDYSHTPVKFTLISAGAGFLMGSLVGKTATYTSQAVIANICANLIFSPTIGRLFFHPQSTETAKGLYFMLSTVASIAISYFIHKKIIQNTTINTPILGKIKEEEEKDVKVITSEEMVKDGKVEYVMKEEVKKFPLGIFAATVIHLATQVTLGMFVYEGKKK